MKKNETGRSMVEMIGVLAVIGVLIITAVMGFRYAMNRQKANQIYNDVKLAYVSFTSEPPYDWTQTEFTPDSGYDLFIRQDKDENNFVLVESVPDEICVFLEDMAEDEEELILYTTMNEIIDCQDEFQDIVFAFDGIPPLIPCEDIGECPEGYNIYCSEEEEVCLTCALGEHTNSIGDGCVDLCSDRTDTYTQTCVSEEEGVNWCCPFDTVCSDVTGRCIDAENVCAYSIAATQAAEMYYTSTCSYTMAATQAAEMYYTATCGYTMAETQAAEMYYTATCGYDFSQTTDADGNITASFSRIDNFTCPTNHYCRLMWTKETWGSGESAPTGFANEYVGEMWGVCVPMSATSGNAQPVYPESKALLTRKNMKCPENHYCRLIWTKETWGSGESAPTGFVNEYVGDMYGVCVPMSATSGNAQPVYPESQNLMTLETDPCDEGQYCNLKWTTTENKCANASIPNDYVGIMYGGCVDLNKVGTAVCPDTVAGIMIPEGE